MRSLWVTLGIVGCADLPEGFEGAERIEDLVQEDCGESPLDEGFVEAVAVSRDGEGLRVTYDPVHFRCAQSIEGYWVQSGSTVEVLLQPMDMRPNAVAACDCGYRIEGSVPSGSSLKAWRRWDHLSGASELVLVGELTLE